MEKLEHAEINQYRNDEHFEFMHDFDSFIAKTKPEELGISDIYPAFKSAFEEEDKTMKIELGSSKSATLKKLDKLRDRTVNAVIRAVDATLLCPIEAEAETAGIIKRILNLYGDKRKASYNEETGWLANLTDDLLSSVNRPHLVTIHILSWVEALKVENDNFRVVLNERNLELAIRESGDVGLLRSTLDPLYEKIITRINATIELNLAKPAVESFVKEVNEKIRYYRNTLIIRHSRAEKEENIPNK